MFYLKLLLLFFLIDFIPLFQFIYYKHYPSVLYKAAYEFIIDLNIFF